MKAGLYQHFESICMMKNFLMKRQEEINYVTLSKNIKNKLKTYAKIVSILAGMTKKNKTRFIKNLDLGYI